MWSRSVSETALDPNKESTATKKAHRPPTCASDLPADIVRLYTTAGACALQQAADFVREPDYPGGGWRVLRRSTTLNPVYPATHNTYITKDAVFEQDAKNELE